MGDQGIAAWKLPLIVKGITVSIVGGFYLGGPGLGMAVGALAAAAIARIAAASAPLAPDEPEPEVRVVAPARNRFLDRWASDTDPGRERAQRSLVLTLASLAQAGIAATARVGDEDLVQTVTDQLREYPATEVFLVTSGAAGEASAMAVEELRSRLHAPFHLVTA